MTTTYRDVHQEIETRFKTLVATPQSLTTEYPNSAPLSPAAGTRWARVTVRADDAGIPEIGPSPRNRIVGVMIVQLFAPLNEGMGETLDIVDAIVQNFRGTSANGIRWDSAYANLVGRDPNGFWQTNVTCRFTADLIY